MQFPVLFLYPLLPVTEVRAGDKLDNPHLHNGETQVGRIPCRDILRTESHSKGKCFAGVQVISFCDAEKHQNHARQNM